MQKACDGTAGSLDVDDGQPATGPALLQNLMKAVEGDGLEEEADEGEEFQAIQAVLQHLQSKHSAKAKQKQTAILSEVSKSISAQAKQVESAVAKEAKDGRAPAAAPLAALHRKLEDKYGQIRVAQERFNAEVQVLWREYEAAYSQLEAAKAQGQGVLTKRTAGVKRKVQELQSAANEQLAAAEKQLGQMHRKPNKVTSVLEKLLGCK